MNCISQKKKRGERKKAPSHLPLRRAVRRVVGEQPRLDGGEHVERDAVVAEFEPRGRFNR